MVSTTCFQTTTAEGRKKSVSKSEKLPVIKVVKVKKEIKKKISETNNCDTFGEKNRVFSGDIHFLWITIVKRQFIVDRTRLSDQPTDRLSRSTKNGSHGKDTSTLSKLHQRRVFRKDFRSKQLTSYQSNPKGSLATKFLSNVFLANQQQLATNQQCH